MTCKEQLAYYKQQKKVHVVSILTRALGSINEIFKNSFHNLKIKTNLRAAKNFITRYRKKSEKSAGALNIF